MKVLPAFSEYMFHIADDKNRKNKTVLSLFSCTRHNKRAPADKGSLDLTLFDILLLCIPNRERETKKTREWTRHSTSVTWPRVGCVIPLPATRGRLQ